MKIPLFAALASVLLTPVLFAQKTGDSVTPAALAKLDWIRGTAPDAWEPGKLYIFECWATWCGPCLAVIPHMDALHDKFESKGLRVIGVNVWENGRDMVAEFVKQKGDGMSYPIAYTGMGGAFETEWLKPAEVRGIPHAFVVKDGKVVFTTHPAQLKESIIEDLLAGGEAEAKVIAGLNAAEEKRAKVSGLMKNFRTAAQQKDADAMAKAIEDLKAYEEAALYVPALNLELLIARSDWAGITTALADTGSDSSTAMVLNQLAQTAVKNPDMPEDLRRTVTAKLAAQLKDRAHSISLQMLSRLQWSLGEKEAALASARRALEFAQSEEGIRMKVPAAPFQNWVEALEKGELPEEKTFSDWYREAQTANKSAVPAGSVK